MNHLNPFRLLPKRSFSMPGLGNPTDPCARTRPRHCSLKSLVDESRFVSGGSPHRAQPPASASHAINASLGRLVVLTIRRLVASNPTCFASLRVSCQSPTKRDGLGTRTIPLELRLSRLIPNSKGFLSVCSTTCFQGNTTFSAIQIVVDANLRDLKPAMIRRQ